jgi:hypothetical protein
MYTVCYELTSRLCSVIPKPFHRAVIGEVLDELNSSVAVAFVKSLLNIYGQPVGNKKLAFVA